MNKHTIDKLHTIIEDLEIIAEDMNYPSRIMGAIKMLEGNNPRTKGDYIKAITEMNETIRVIDGAIPQHIFDDMQKLGFDCSQYGYAYYKNGTSAVINVVAEWAILINNQ